MAGIFLFWLAKNNIAAHTLLTCICITIGFLLAGKAERILNRKDAPFIVIDEVSGMLLSLLFIPFDYKLVIMGFVLFRILDTLKPYPAGLLQRLKGSAGIMSDDIIAGLYTNIILQAVLRLASFRPS